MSSLVDLEEYLHREIPLTAAMKLRVIAHRDGFALEAPVTANSNHLRTAFGGSINSVATLAAYGWLWLSLGPGGHAVIARSEIRFLRPIHQTIRAVCEVRDNQQISRRVKVRVHVFDGETPEVAAIFEGEFVVAEVEP